MKVETSIFGINFEVETGYNTVEEFDALAGKSGACLEQATMHVVAHRYLGKVRTAVVEALEKITGIPREKTTDEKGENVKYVEQEKAYFDRVLKEKAGSDEWTSILEQLKEVASNVKLELKAAVRSRISKEDRNAAKLIIDSGKAEAFARKAGFDGELPSGEELVELIAGMYKKLLAQKMAEAQQSVLAL